MRLLRLWASTLALAFSVTLSFGAIARAAELVMYSRAGCAWCVEWERVIAPIYPKTDVGRRAPLRVIDLDRDRNTDIALTTPVRYTPTFVVVENGREIGRIEGYAGEHFFWGQVEQLVPNPPSSKTSGKATLGL